MNEHDDAKRAAALELALRRLLDTAPLRDDLPVLFTLAKGRALSAEQESYIATYKSAREAAEAALRDHAGALAEHDAEVRRAALQDDAISRGGHDMGR